MKGSIVSTVLLAGCVGVAGLVISRWVPASAGAAVPIAGAKGDVPGPEVSKFIESEIARQLPGAVNKEIDKRLDALDQVALQRRYEAEKRAKVDSARSTLQTLRSQLELYKIQHGDRFPTMGQLADWSTMLRKTDREGKVSLTGEFGPYFQAAPVNPMNQNSRVRPAGSASINAGWTWDEKKGVLRLLVSQQQMDFYKGLAAEDVDVLSEKMVFESPEVKFNAVASTMQTLRSELELFKIQHKDCFPTMAQMADWGILIQRSGSDGKIHSGSGESFGPYLSGVPVNPYTGLSKVVAAGLATKEAGWTWDEKRGILRAVIPVGEMDYLTLAEKEYVEVVK